MPRNPATAKLKAKRPVPSGFPTGAGAKTAIQPFLFPSPEEGARNRNVLLTLDSWVDLRRNLDAFYLNFAKKWEKGTFNRDLAKKGIKGFLDRVSTQHRKLFDEPFSIAERNAAAEILVNDFLEDDVVDNARNLFPTKGKRLLAGNRILGVTAPSEEAALKDAMAEGPRERFFSQKP